MLGELLGARYKVVRILGAGGFGHTYIAEDTQRPGNPCCVLKHLTFASTNTVVLDHVRRLFQAEAETLEKLGKHDQIPQLLAYFEENKEFYLVQEFIEGISLSDELGAGKKLSESQVITMLDDVLGILEYVHSQNVIHRDIKPENLIHRQCDRRFVLIDFGAVKTIGQTIAEAAGETNVSVPIYTSGYAASEHCLGRPRFSSDLYSLGMVAIQCLTGMRPSQLPQDFNTSEILWRDQAPVSDALADFLDQMVRYHFMHRFQSATEALQALRQIISHSPTVMTEPPIAVDRAGDTLVPAEQTQPQPLLPLMSPSPPKPFWRKPVLLVTGGTVAVILAIAALAQSLHLFSKPDSPSSENPSPAATDLPFATLQERTSTGERILNTWRAPSPKQEGVEKYRAGDYSAAVAAFQSAWNKDPDPETLIYLNNARIGQGRSYKIAVAIPIGDSALSTALEILQGVAQLQDEVNRTGGIGGVPLKVEIVNDGNNPRIAQQLARSLVADPAVLAVVGHGTSDITVATAEIYQASQMVMIAPVSSATQLSNMGRFIFRTMPNDRLTAQALVNYSLNHWKKRKAVVFFNAGSFYSKSLKNELSNALLYGANLEPLEEFDLSRPDFDAYESVNRAIARGAEVILLAPDWSTSNQAIQVVQMNNGRLKILSGDSLYSQKLLKVAQKAAVGMVLAIPSDPGNATFTGKMKQLWGANTPFSWRAATAYDATKALVAALKQDPTRMGVQRILSQPGFSTEGATGVVQFSPETGDRKGGVKLITVVPSQTSQSPGCQFKTLQ
jgi:ABC-type branched-subunit amino acid transport system substrate-binding protein/predicted Ser/Thr protein kinase